MSIDRTVEQTYKKPSKRRNRPANVPIQTNVIRALTTTSVNPNKFANARRGFCWTLSGPDNP